MFSCNMAYKDDAIRSAGKKYKIVNDYKIINFLKFLSIKNYHLN